MESSLLSFLVFFRPSLVHLSRISSIYSIPERLFHPSLPPELYSNTRLHPNFYRLLCSSVLHLFLQPIFTSALHSMLYSIFSSNFIPSPFYLLLHHILFSSRIPSLSPPLHQPLSYLTETTGKSSGIHRKRIFHRTCNCNVMISRKAIK